MNMWAGGQVTRNDLRDLQVELLKLSQKAAGIKNEELGREIEQIIAKAARVFGG